MGNEVHTGNSWLLEVVNIIFLIRSLLHFVIGAGIHALELQKLLRNLARSSGLR
jgi:hypothetical protein